MTKIDPILLSVYARTFKSITDEMSISVEKSARSPILCEAKDFVTGLYDAHGNMLAQTENLPILLSFERIFMIKIISCLRSKITPKVWKKRPSRICSKNFIPPKVIQAQVWDCLWWIVSSEIIQEKSKY